MIAASFLIAGILSAQPAEIHADEVPNTCGNCAAWNAPRTPFKIHGNSYYVGVNGLSAVLIASTKGHILIDGGLPQSADVIKTHIQTLGFDVRDVKWLLNSHAHYDHAGGLAALQRMSGAPAVASSETVRALKLGRALPDDPQYAADNTMSFPAVAVLRSIQDGGALVVDSVKVTAHDTPGHAPGGNTWSWKSCEAGKCSTIVFADSLNPVSEPSYRFSDHPAYLKAFRQSIAKVRALDCDILVSAHPDFSDLFDKAAAGSLVDANGCRNYADAAEARLNKRLTVEAVK